MMGADSGGRRTALCGALPPSRPRSVLTWRGHVRVCLKACWLTQGVMGAGGGRGRAAGGEP
eukprot:3554266-Rhodomonas_salina.1